MPLGPTSRATYTIADNLLVFNQNFHQFALTSPLSHFSPNGHIFHQVFLINIKMLGAPCERPQEKVEIYSASRKRLTLSSFFYGIFINHP